MSGEEKGMFFCKAVDKFNKVKWRGRGR